MQILFAMADDRGGRECTVENGRQTKSFMGFKYINLCYSLQKPVCS